jgi:Flp pilus assembly protein TadG
MDLTRLQPPGGRAAVGRVARWCAAGDCGSAAVEITLVTPLLVVVLLFMVFLGRLTEARAVVADAAHQAARAASIAPGPVTAAAQGRQAAVTALAGRGLACQHLAINIDLGGFTPGGTVRATVTCTTGLSDLALLAVPGSHTLTASFTSVIDTHGGQALGPGPGQAPQPGLPAGGV